MRYGMGWRLGKVVGLSVGIAALALLTVAVAKDKIASARQAALVEDLKSGMALDLEGLAERFTAEQLQFMPILPPDPEFRLHQPSGGIISFDPSGFPKDFLDGLVYDIDHGCPVYTVTVWENSFTGEILFYNGYGKPIASLPPVKDYDLWWLFERFHPELSTRQVVDEQAAWLMSLFNPLRLEIEIKLLPADYIETYAAGVIASSPEPVESVTLLKGAGVKMMKMEAASTSIVIAAIFKPTTNMLLTMQYPDDFTNRL